MNTERIIELITDAVTDAVRDRLPALIAQHAKALYDPICERVKSAEAALDRLAANAVPPDAFEAVREDVRLLLCEASTAHAALMAGLPVHVAAEVKTAVAAITLPAGPSGPQGEPGRDGTFIAPVPYVAGAEVERGTIVRFDHALWYAHTKTNAAPNASGSGYTLVLEVPVPTGSEADASGARSLIFRDASGEEFRVPLGFRPQTYEGVFDATRNYFENQSVTCGGSRWIARHDSIGIRPGTDAGGLVWQLEVKCGKDGRDGAPGPAGPRGEPGPPGAAPPLKRKAPNGASHD
jgi:hypothetical protein